MRLLLGVDGGGTKTSACLCSEGPDGRLCLLASGRAGGSNPLSVGWPACEQALADAIGQVLAAAPDKPAKAVLAVAGCASPDACGRLAAWADRQAFARVLSVVPDTQPLLADAPVGPAIGVIAGTGSSVVVRDAEGATQLVGGWGYLIGDEGSGFAIGRDALAHIARRTDAGAGVDRLTEAVLHHTSAAVPAELKSRLYGADDSRGWAASLAPVVLGLAEAGDPAAAEIVARGVAALAALAEQAAERLPSNGSWPLIRLAGALLARSVFYRRLLVARLKAAGWQAEQIRLAPDGAIGCALLAQTGD